MYITRIQIRIYELLDLPFKIICNIVHRYCVLFQIRVGDINVGIADIFMIWIFYIKRYFGTKWDSAHSLSIFNGILYVLTIDFIEYELLYYNSHFYCLYFIFINLFICVACVVCWRRLFRNSNNSDAGNLISSIPIIHNILLRSGAWCYDIEARDCVTFWQRLKFLKII